MINIRVSVVVVKDDKILLVKHYRREKNYWVLPGGKVRQGETLEECGIREVVEESCLHVRIIEFLYIGETIWPEGERHTIEVFFRGEPLSESVQKSEWSYPDERSDYPEWLSLEEFANLEVLSNIQEPIIEILKGNHGKPYYLGNLLKTFSSSFGG